MGIKKRMIIKKLKAKNHILDVVYPCIQEDVGKNDSAGSGRKSFVTWGGYAWRHRYDIIASLFRKKLIVDYTEIVCTTYCSLRCRDCANLIQYYGTSGNKKPYHTNIESNIEAIDRLLSAVDIINNFSILGGEPLLYPDIVRLCEYISSQKRIHRVMLITNGTVSRLDDRLKEILRNKKFTVVISSYGVNSNKQQELLDMLEKNEISYEQRFVDDKWVDYGDLRRRRRDDEELVIQYQKCRSYCRSLLNGRLYQCPRASNGHDLGIIEPMRGEYIDLLDRSIGKKRLRGMLMDFYRRKGAYIAACDYCDNAVGSPIYIEPGIQVKNEG